MTTAYPLSWPAGWPRTPKDHRTHATFGKRDSGTNSYAIKRDLTTAEGIRRIFGAVRGFTKVGRQWRIDPDDLIISTNVPVRLDGLPRSGMKEPDDPGVAIYWVEKVDGRNVQRAMAIDRYTTVADNLAAIAATLDAMRAIERHGGAQILDRAFTGFTALTAAATSRSWREVLGVAANVRDMATVRAAYRVLASRHHPDKGGTHEAMAELNVALARAEHELASDREHQL